MNKNILGNEMLPDERELDCMEGHKKCYCAGRAECHNCGMTLSDDYEPQSESKSDKEEI